MILELCKGVHCVDLDESFQTHIYLEILASIPPRTSPVKFARSSGAAGSRGRRQAAAPDPAAPLRAVRRGAALRLVPLPPGAVPEAARSAVSKIRKISKN